MSTFVHQTLLSATSAEVHRTAVISVTHRHVANSNAVAGSSLRHLHGLIGGQSGRLDRLQGHTGLSGRQAFFGRRREERSRGIDVGQHMLLFDEQGADS